MNVKNVIIGRKVSIVFPRQMRVLKYHGLVTLYLTLEGCTTRVDNPSPFRLNFIRITSCFPFINIQTIIFILNVKFKLKIELLN